MSKRIPSLDGWRGIAILLVLTEHTQTALLGGRPILNTGQHGVTIFFVLSGFLITSKLLEGPIDLKTFYVRRFFRLMPTAWAYLAFVAICDIVLRQHQLTGGAATTCVFFFRNFIAAPDSVATGHFWSLSLEEQFYFFWPALLFLIGVKKCRWVALAGILACASWRYMHWNLYSSFPHCFQTHVRADALLVGCLLAFVMADSQMRTLVGRWAKYFSVAAFPGLIYYILRYPWLPPLGENICIAALIASSVSHPNHRLSRWLDARPLAALGVVSYSVYVWQQYFFEIRRGPIATPLMMAIMPLFAWASYRLIEQPCRRLGYRLTSKSREREVVQVA